MPVVSGLDVVRGRPDPFSKFHNVPGPAPAAAMTPVQAAPREDDHGFSPMPNTTPVAPKRGTPMPVVSGLGVVMESPDPYSKFHNGPGPATAVAMTPVQEAPKADDHGFSPMLDTTEPKDTRLYSSHALTLYAALGQ